MRENVRKYISGFIALLVCVSLIISLKFSLINIEYKTLDNFDNFDIITETYSENGFDFFEKQGCLIAEYFFDDWAVRVSECICFLSVGIGALGCLLVLLNFLSSVKKAKKLCTASITMAFIVSFLYSFLGAAYYFSIDAEMAIEFLWLGEIVGTWEIIRISTSAFFSFSAVLFFGVMYFVAAPNVNYIDKELAQNEVFTEKEFKTAEMLLKYNELLQKGVITEGEYENKKRLLLGDNYEDCPTDR